MAIDPIDPTQIGQNPAALLGGGPQFFGAGVPSSGLLYNALRQAGIFFDPSNPRIARLMRMAPALTEAFALNQAMNPTLTDVEAPNANQVIRDFWMNAIGGGAAGAIQQAMRNVKPAYEQAVGLNAAGAAPGENPWLEALRGRANNPQKYFELRQALISPFLSATQAQDLERGNELAMMGMYGRAEAEGKGIMQSILGLTQPPTPYDETQFTGGITPSAPALPAPAPPQGLELNPITPAPALPAPAVTPPISPADEEYLDELLRRTRPTQIVGNPAFVPQRGQYPVR